LGQRDRYAARSTYHARQRGRRFHCGSHHDRDINKHIFYGQQYFLTKHDDGNNYYGNILIHNHNDNADYAGVNLHLQHVNDHFDLGANHDHADSIDGCYECRDYINRYDGDYHNCAEYGWWSCD
jgi:hypothetical protein